MAAAIAAALPGELLRATRDQLSSLRLLAGGGVEVHAPRSTVLRLRRDAEGRASLSFSQVLPGPPGVDLLGLPLFRAVSGRATR